MGSLSKWDQEKALKATMFLCLQQLQGREPEEQGAQQLDFGSIKAMRTQLGNWGAPDWITQEEPADEKPRAPRPAPSERQARSSGPVKELPPASNATPLFQEKLEALARGNDELRSREEKLQGGLFIESRVWPDRSYVNLTGLPEETKQLFAPALEDASESGGWLTNGILFNTGGGTPAPSPPLPALIAAYFLMEGKIEPLLDALYPGTPPAEVVEKIRKRIEDKKSARTEDGLKALAQQLAALVRGRKLERGRNSGELPPRDNSLACRITELRQAGWADDEIFEELRSYGLSGEELTRKEFRRLANLELRWPWA
jgi:hypothetical protein